MSWALLAFCCILAVEAVFQLKPLAAARQINMILRKIMRVLLSRRISDHWKEKVLPAYAWLLFQKTLYLLLPLTCILALFAGASFLPVPWSTELFSILSTPLGLVVSTWFAILYSSVRGYYARK